jgi:quercetin dioxygenase-like cupin family protein
MEIFQGARSGLPCERRLENFSGTVWAETFVSRPGEFLHGCVYFAPGARTFWHRHERGQIINVTAGAGLVCSADGAARRINVGDIVWIAPGERHWHGAAPENFMVHVVTSFGQTTWFEAVEDQGLRPWTPLGAARPDPRN